MESSCYEPVIGLEIHAELITKSKMFCACPVVDSTSAAPNTAVCAVCAGLPGVLPVVNEQAVAYAIKVGLALHCEIHETSVFERKNYFYPDLPKGYQISQYQYPLAEHGYVTITTAQGERNVRVNRVHMEEDAGKLTHVLKKNEQPGKTEEYSLVDLNRAGVPLLEIVTEPDIFSLEEMRAYATELRAILRVLGVNSGDMEKGVIRFEANISLRPAGSQTLGKRVEIKNLNSFKIMERAVAYEIERQRALLSAGAVVEQETRGFNENTGETYIMRSKEDAHDYRYFPEPDLPPLVVAQNWVEDIRATLPELPGVRASRLVKQYQLEPVQAALLVESYEVADYFEAAVPFTKISPRLTALWITDAYFAWMNERGHRFDDGKATPAAFAALLNCLEEGKINRATGSTVLFAMLDTGKSAEEIIREQNLEQLSDETPIRSAVLAVLAENPTELQRYKDGKVELANWFFGKVMKATAGKANPALVRSLLAEELDR